MPLPGSCGYFEKDEVGQRIAEVYQSSTVVTFFSLFRVGFLSVAYLMVANLVPLGISVHC